MKPSRKIHTTYDVSLESISCHYEAKEPHIQLPRMIYLSLSWLKETSPQDGQSLLRQLRLCLPSLPALHF